MKKIYAFWTGGWDSTYMIIQLLKQKYSIQPIYVIDERRNGRNNEIKAMKKIQHELEKLNYFEGQLLPLIKINLSDINKNAETTKSYNNICKEIKLGSQYDWLARLALNYPKIAVGIEKPNGEFSGCVEAIEKNGKLSFKDGIAYIDKDNSNQDCNNIFGNLCFPIINITETEMLKNIKLWNLEKVMENIWFCHNPIRNKPCGTCRPCQQKMECEMEFLVPKKSQKRYRIFHFLDTKINNFSAKIYSKIIHIINKK